MVSSILLIVAESTCYNSGEYIYIYVYIYRDMLQDIPIYRLTLTRHKQCDMIKAYK